MRSYRFGSAQCDVDGTLWQIDVEATLIEFSHQRALQLVALIEESDAERKAEIAEDFSVFRPGDDRARAHHGGQIAVGESVAREVSQPHHLVDGGTACVVAIMLRLGEH